MYWQSIRCQFVRDESEQSQTLLLVGHWQPLHLVAVPEIFPPFLENRR